jgi:hypothetical protein
MVKNAIQDDVTTYFLHSGREQTKNIVASAVTDIINEVNSKMKVFWQNVNNCITKYLDTDKEMLVFDLDLEKNYNVFGYCNGDKVVIEKIYLNAAKELTVLVKYDNGREVHVFPLSTKDNYYLYFEENVRSWIISHICPSYRDALKADWELNEAWNAFLNASAKYIARRNCGDIDKTRDRLEHRLKYDNDLFDTIDMKF